MRKTKLFFVACWALMLAMQAHAKAVTGDESVQADQLSPQIKCMAKAATNRTLTADQLRGRLVDALLNCEMYSSYKNAAQFVESLSDEDVQALLDPTSDVRLIKMVEAASAGMPPVKGIYPTSL